MIAGVSRSADPGTPNLHQGSKVGRVHSSPRSWALQKKPWRNFAFAVPAMSGLLFFFF